MKALERAFERRAVEQTFSLRDPALRDVLSGGFRSVAGVNVTPENSLRVSGWYAGVQIISGSLASLPCITYERLDRGKGRAVNHPNYRILHDEPNPWMSPTEYFENAQAHVLGWGNHFSLIERNGAGNVVALWPLAPDRVRMQVVREQDRIWYFHYPEGGGEQQLRMEDVLHVRGLARPHEFSVWGYSPVDLAREALGLAKIEEEYRARFFKSDARPLGIVEYPTKMNDQAYERFKKDWQDTYGGAERKVGFLEEGLKWHNVGFAPEAAEFIEGRKFQLEEIARILRIPLVLLQSTEKNTTWGSGVEQFVLGFIQFTMREWIKRWERRLNISLFTPVERKRYFCEFLIKDMLRADSLTEAQVLQIERRNGIINANDWLEITNRNPLPDNLGDKYVIEANMTTLDKVGEEDEPEAAPLMNGNGNGANAGRYLNGRVK